MVMFNDFTLYRKIEAIRRSSITIIAYYDTYTHHHSRPTEDRLHFPLLQC